ncbi:hypothetical protein E2C01_000286 [Portunus trituberculatus]|uniref:Secreted protein n=1 Tax=Portunus trituberculatus TaxID=210409 RepID=A0A5B7CEU0_PORTR|nr:hypothetical protein [Portunus trituberculatus]
MEMGETSLKILLVLGLMLRSWREVQGGMTHCCRRLRKLLSLLLEFKLAKTCWREDKLLDNAESLASGHAASPILFTPSLLYLPALPYLSAPPSSVPECWLGHKPTKGGIS